MNLRRRSMVLAASLLGLFAGSCSSNDQQPGIASRGEGGAAGGGGGAAGSAASGGGGKAGSSGAPGSGGQQVTADASSGGPPDAPSSSTADASASVDAPASIDASRSVDAAAPIADGGSPPVDAGPPANVGTTINVAASGAYSVTFKNPNWTFAGNLGAAASGISTRTGSDRLGPYSETTFTYTASGNRTGRIRAYVQTPVVVFGETSAAAVANTRNFPRLTSAPSLPYHITYGVPFIDYSMTAFNADSPWVFFDASANSYIISGASHFMNTQTAQIGTTGVVSGIQSNIATLPAGFEVTTVLVADPGINQAYLDWGQALLSFTGKVPVANDSTPVLGKFGYWTDNTSAYYYRTETGVTYPQTLVDVRRYFETQNALPLAYMQLDSWWYPKGPMQDWSDGADGEYLYVAAPALFPDGLAAFQQMLGIPLVTHARWIDPSSPYKTQFQSSGNTIIDPAFWTMVANYLRPAGVMTFEQDWLSVNGIPVTTNLTDQDAYLDNMARAMQTAGIDIQYCEPQGKHILQSTKYPNLTNSRVSDDGFNRALWRTYFYGARFASAVGLWPWTDVFKSTDRDSVLISSLSTGLLGASDAIGAADFASLKRALRNDGTIIKPDVPLLLLDRSIVDEARRAGSATIATSYTQHAGGRFSYVFAFTDTANVTASFTPAELGYAGNVYVYDVNNDVGRVTSAAQATTAQLATTTSTAYYLVSPVGPSGIAILGERGKIAPLGKKRVSALADDGAVTVTIAFGAGEGPITLQGYATAAPTVTAVSGMAGPMSYDASTQRFTLPVTGAGTSATLRLTR